MLSKRRIIERIAGRTTQWAGSSVSLLLAFAVVLIWLAVGPLFDFSNNWQLVITTTTSIVTFLMVFLIQRAQNKEMMAIQLKLNELIATIHGASNRLINIEKLTEEEGITLHQQYAVLADHAKEKGKTIDSLSIENFHPPEPN